jgi:hypothetical protein
MRDVGNFCERTARRPFCEFVHDTEILLLAGSLSAAIPLLNITPTAQQYQQPRQRKVRARVRWCVCAYAHAWV